MALRRYKRRTTRRGALKRSVKKVISSLAETKTYQNIISDEFNLSDISNVRFTYGSVMPATFGQGVGSTARLGNDIMLKGVRLSMSYDNSSPTANIPLYITTFCIVTNDSQAVTIENLLKGAAGEQGLTSAFLATPSFKHLAHTTPVNNSIYKVVHKSSVRLGCKSDPDLPGPRFAQRVVYIPMNKRIKFSRPLTEIEEIKPRILMVTLVSNPTQLGPGTGPASVTYECISYFNDI